MYSCPYCSAVVGYGQNKCLNCGKKLNWHAPKIGSPSSSQNPYGYQYPQQQQYMRDHLGTIPEKNRTTVRTALLMAGIILLTICVIAFIANDVISNMSKPPVVKSFDVNPSTITQGQTATLQWNVSGAKSVSIEPGIGTMSSVGTQSISPSTSTTYTLSATNGAGSTTSTTTVVVTVKNPPVITGFTANPGNITPGQSSTLQWNVTGATSVTIDQDIGTVSSSGTLPITPTKDVTFHIVATNSAGSITATATVIVAMAGPPVIQDFSVTPHIVYAGKPSTLQWDVMGTTSVTIDQGIGTVCSAGTVTVSPPISTMYTLTATNSNSNITKTAYITVIPGQSSTGLPTAPTWSPT